MSNVFAALMEPLRFRPGDSHPPAQKTVRVVEEEKALTPEQIQRRENCKRRPNAHLPHIENPWGLTPLRCAVIAGIAEGKGNADIGASLSISGKTVEVHIQKAKADMGGVSRARAAVLWDRFVRGDNDSEAST